MDGTGPEARSFLNSGWDFLTPEGQLEIEKLNDVERGERDQLDHAFLACFEGGAGLTVLKHLCQFIWESPAFDWSLPADQAAAQGFAREGQRALINYIYACMERARKERQR